ncbi:MAG: carbohydrate ABC transporter permease, partial [Kiritimatiellae bacterium]|nr:carbohydrate ABC transporter permease [Kiritimatiellia bacterium]
MPRLNPALRLTLYLLLAAESIVFLLPLAWMVVTALKPIEQTMSVPPVWLPYRYSVEAGGEPVAVRLGKALDDGNVEVVAEQGGVVLTVPRASIRRTFTPRWGNFREAVRAMKRFSTYLRNTLLLCLLTVTGTVISSALAAYGFACIPWRGRKRVFLVALATMMIPFPVVMVPLYSLYRWLGWIGTLQPLWVGSFFASAFNVFLLRQFFMTIPKDLADAARVDGCGD